MGFFLKKFIGAVVMPLPVIFLMAGAGAALRYRGVRPRLARGLLIGAALLLWAASCEPLTEAGIRRLERGYPVFPQDSVAAVVVLGSGHVSDPEVPPGARLSGPALYRLAEGLRIANEQPWAQVILSGYGGGDPISHAEAYQDVAVGLGLDPTRIVLEPRGVDTAAEARLIAPLVEGRPFALVTSASHMRRAMALFRAQGLTPVAAPTGHLAPRRVGFDYRQLLPSEGALIRSRQLWYEILGAVWVRLRGQV